MTTLTSASAPSAKLDHRLVTIGVVVVLGAIMSIIDATAVNVATRTLAEDFGASITSVQWVLTGYMLGLAAVIPVTGWATERFGARRVWITALLLFLAGSALAGLAWSMPALIAFRVLQGAGGGMIIPVAQTILAQAAGPSRMGRVMGFIGLPMLLGSVAGPIVGGLIISTAGWRWIFFVNLPLGVVAVVAAFRLLPSSPPRPTSLDVRGLLLLCGGVTAFVYGTTEAGRPGALDAIRPWTILAGGLALIIAYVMHARGRSALIDISLFRHRGFAAAAVTNVVVAVALFGVLVLLPLYWQIVRGHGPLATGLLLAPQALGAAVAMPLAGRVTDRLGAGLVVPAGIVLGLLGTAAYTQIHADTSPILLAAALFVIGLGLGATIMPSMAAAYQALPPALIPRATSAINTLQRMGASVGTTALAVILQHEITAQSPGLAGAALAPLPDSSRVAVAPLLATAFGHAFWIALAVGALAIVPALLLPRRPASE
ncbi:DHA2 family efflux MFS transporter permease subunit [Actinomadura darangshiensis]|uniref:DHA2 family efflux MFS transporter permease subunit n=1 Tax=Actinomadura darangshiensis TaxID=705336 RepID=A0A4R5BAF2_9ACTN|nr:DHA2 family efflux MFS transporter permease subunit [Actinomadura darangshiensis]TDD80402.1 DHA2 family efflux MFS transporter permease subunit [Actinomadura darangshiensis]